MKGQGFRFGAIVKSAGSLGEWTALAKRLEGLGYSTMIVGDHIRNQWGPLVGLTAAATATKSIGLATNVLNNDFRNPVVLAQELATLDVVSGGRVEVGIGAGYSGTDYRATGIAHDRASVRIARLGEAVRIMKAYWSEGEVDFTGEHYDAHTDACFPRTVAVPGPRLCIGGGGPKVLSLAAREADIVSLSPSFGSGGLTRSSIHGASIESFVERVEWVRDAAGPRFGELEFHLSLLFTAVGDGRGARQVIHLATREHGLSEAELAALPIAAVGSVEAICDKLLALRERLGITYFSVADPMGFAPVVAKLAGRPLTLDRARSSARRTAAGAVRGAQRRLHAARQRDADRPRAVAPTGPSSPATPVMHRVVLFGAAGMGDKWVRKFLPRFEDRCEIAAVVDVDGEALDRQGEFSKVPPARRFRSIADAGAALRDGQLREVDTAFVIVPPAFHRDAIEASLEAGLAILCEKPLATTWDDCVAIYKAVNAAGAKLQVVQNYRDAAAVATAKQLIESGRVGPLNYLVSRFAMDYRVRNSWGGPFRHEMAHAMIIEGAAHHLDLARHVAGSNFKGLLATDWRPAAALGFDGECCALVIGEFESGARFCYEASAVGAGVQAPWAQDELRFECADATVVVSNNQVQLVRNTKRGPVSERIDNVRIPWIGHHAMLNDFFTWVDGGAPAPTALDDAIATAAAVFATIESSEAGRRVDVSAMLAQLPT